MKKLIGIGLIITAALGLGACTSDKTQLNDAPVGKIDDSPAFIITNPDQFPNIAIRCYGVNGIYSTTRTGANGIIVVTNDPTCSKVNNGETTVNGNGGK